MKIKILDREYDDVQGRDEVVAAFETQQGPVQIILSSTNYFLLCGRSLSGRYHLRKTYYQNGSYSRDNLAPAEAKSILLRHLGNDSSFNDSNDLTFDRIETEINAQLRDEVELENPVTPVSKFEGTPAASIEPVDDKVAGYDKGTWIIAAVLLVVGVIVVAKVMDPAGKKEKAEAQLARDINEFEKEEARRERMEEGLKARDSFDEAMRTEAGQRRARLEKASKTVRTTNTNGVRLDQYILQKGGIISCTTTLSGNSPAMFNCDGDV
ncbi:MAG: hypothetical protein Q8N13_22605 [Acidovorax sp.]|nr:hypothetical protein [Acidovorax sp.]